MVRQASFEHLLPQLCKETSQKLNGWCLAHGHASHAIDLYNYYEIHDHL
jgi:hypothetical protein